MNPKYITVHCEDPLPNVVEDWRDGFFKMWHLKHLVSSPFSGYGVRSDGCIVKLERLSLRDRRPRKMKSSFDKSGYAVVNLRGNKQYVHRLVASAFLKNPEDKPQVAHKDGDPSNPHVLNLRWSTQKENEADKIRHGTARWQDRGSRTFTQEQCEDLTLEYSLCLSFRKLAKKYGVSHQTIKTAIIYGSALN